MARKRTIDPDLWSDDRVQSLPSTFAMLLYIGLISMADDEGRVEWNSRQILARTFPRRMDVQQHDVEDSMAAIASVGLVTVYEVDGRQCAAHPEWRKNQYVNRPSPSKLPPPPMYVNESMSHSPTFSVIGSVNASVRDSVSPQVPTVSASDSGSNSVSESASESVFGGARNQDGNQASTTDEDAGLEDDILAVLANLAAERGGILTPDVQCREREHLSRAKQRYGAAALRHGLAEAASRGKPPRYAIAAASNFVPGDARAAFNRSARPGDARFRADMAEMAATMRDIAKSGVVV